MKNHLAFLFLFFTLTITVAQSNNDIASVYLKRCEESLDNLEIEKSFNNFNKALKYLDSITTPNVAKLGTYINYELKNYTEAKSFAKTYFSLQKNKNLEEYTTILDLYITINERIEKKLAEENKIAQEKLKKEKELRKTDSLTEIWKDKAKTLSVNADSVYNFNKNNIAVYSYNGSFGIINDTGKVIVEAKKFKHKITFDGFILLLDKEKEPTKIYSYNTVSKSGFILPSPSEFNTNSTNYGTVMLPRANGMLVAYPNNSYTTMVYNLVSKKFVKVADFKDLFKTLKTNDVIDKYNNDNEIKVKKDWYIFGGDLGEGMYPLYEENIFTVKAFLSSVGGELLFTANTYQSIGAYYNYSYQAIENGKTFWINKKGTKVSDVKDESGEYSGKSIIKKFDSGLFQIIKDNTITNGSENLEMLPEFLKKYNN